MLAELLEIAREVANANVVNYVQEIIMRSSNEEFYPAVLGLFKRGKSTLINALLSEEILPSEILPLTSMLTMVRYGERVSAKIVFQDGSVKDISPSQIQDYITESGNPGNIMCVREAEIQAPSRILRNGVVIIDTPGVESTYLSNTKTTYEFMEKVDAALFVLGVDLPISQQEVELIKHLKQYAAKIILVLNKIDYVDEATLKEALGFCEKVVEDTLKFDSITIFPTSAKMALQERLSTDASVLPISGIDRLEAILAELFSKGKGELILRSTANKALRALTDLCLTVELKIRTITMPMDELDQALRTFESTLKSIESRKHELLYLLDGEVKEVVSMLDQDLENFKNEHEGHFVAAA
jgi:small GTP-binding protein